jgi:RES domain-containing protein
LRCLWRISNHLNLEGEGGRFFSSRWSATGHRIVFLAESPAGAMLEILVHLQFRDRKLPETYHLLQVEATEPLAVEPLDPSPDPEWKEQPEVTRRLGNAWLESLATPLARVPSAIVPHIWNYLLNPEHPDASKLKIEAVIRERFDNRLFRFGSQAS